VDFEGTLERAVEIGLWFWPFIEALGGWAKVAELGLVLAVLVGMLWTGHRTKKAAREFRQQIEGAIALLDTKFEDLTERMKMLRTDMQEIEKQQDRTFVSIDSVPSSQGELAEGLLYWEQVRDAWGEIRSGLQDVVMALPSRLRRNMEALDWRDYSGVIAKLSKSGNISAEAETCALAVKDLFHKLNRKKANVTAEQGRLARSQAEAFKLAIAAHNVEANQPDRRGGQTVRSQSQHAA